MNSKELLKKLTIEEKVKWTSGRNLWQFLGNERLGIEMLRCADGPHGVRTYNTSDLGNELIRSETLNPSTMFPVAAAMASTFNDELIELVGKTIGDECNMYDVDVLLAPGINLKRSPLGGRNFEYYSEDPYLTMRMGSAFVKGVQSTGVGATIKHFALNEQESQRRFIDTIIDERTLHELYLYPFRKIIENENPYMIMSSYNKIRGDYAAESKEFLTDILRNKWKYNGAVISDWTSVQDKVKSLKASLNLEMPYESELYDQVHKALKNGQLTEIELDMILKPLMLLRDRVLENSNKGKKSSLKDNHRVAYQVARESIVLLENDGILPLKGVSSLGIIGEFAEKPRVNGGGSATLKAYELEIPLDYLRKEFAIDYSRGYVEENTNGALLLEVEEVCKNNDIIIYFTGTTEALESEGRERPHMMIPEGHKEVFEVIKKSGKKVIVVLNNGSALDLRVFDGHVNAVIESWLLGGANSKALLDVLTGRFNPSGRLSETFPIRIEHTPFYGEYPCMQDVVNYSSDLLRLGYRYYDTHKYDVKYPFGYGLSYSKFEYSNLKFNTKTLHDKEDLTLTFDIENIGSFDGHEVAQIYVRDLESFYPKPTKELKGYSKVYIKAGETKKVSVVLKSEAFSTYIDDLGEFRVEPGKFEVIVGRNVRDAELRDTVDYITDKPFRRNLNETDPITNYKLYDHDVYKYLVDQYGKIEWYDMEQPMHRILFRIRRDFELSDKDFDSLKKIVYK